jgi:hypothetical protein
MQGRTVKDLTAELLREGLGLARKSVRTQTEASPQIVIDQDGFPAFRCLPSAPASSMTVDELLKLEIDASRQEDLTRAGISR